MGIIKDLSAFTVLLVQNELLFIIIFQHMVTARNTLHCCVLLLAGMTLVLNTWKSIISYQSSWLVSHVVSILLVHRSTTHQKLPVNQMSSLSVLIKATVSWSDYSFNELTSHVISTQVADCRWTLVKENVHVLHFLWFLSIRVFPWI